MMKLFKKTNKKIEKLSILVKGLAKCINIISEMEMKCSGPNITMSFYREAFYWSNLIISDDKRALVLDDLIDMGHRIFTMRY